MGFLKRTQIGRGIHTECLPNTRWKPLNWTGTIYKGWVVGLLQITVT
jgi:hypothetical protein